MPDPEILVERAASLNLSKPPIADFMGFHEFVESEFAPGSGQCDRCGGGAASLIHNKPVDPLVRIADALERIAAVLEASITDTLPPEQGGGIE